MSLTLSTVSGNEVGAHTESICWKRGRLGDGEGGDREWEKENRKARRNKEEKEKIFLNSIEFIKHSFNNFSWLVFLDNSNLYTQKIKLTISN